MKLKKIPSSKQEPMWKSDDDRFLVMSFREYTNRKGKKFYTLTYSVLERAASGKYTIDHGEAKDLKGVKRLIEKVQRNTPQAKRVALRFASRRNVLVSELSGNRVWSAVVQIGDRLYLELLEPARGIVAVLDRREVWLPEGMTAEEALYRNAWGRKGAPEIIEYDIDEDKAELRKLRSQYRRKKR